MPRYRWLRRANSLAKSLPILSSCKPASPLTTGLDTNGDIPGAPGVACFEYATDAGFNSAETDCVDFRQSE